MEDLKRDQSSKNEKETERANGENKNGDQNFENEIKAEEEKVKDDKEEEEKVLQFLDSLDSYLTHMDSLSSILRQGWFDLASARYSMGTSRVTSALFDLKLHPAATTFQVNQVDGEYYPQVPMLKQPNFALSRWSSSSDENCCSRDPECDEDYLQRRSNSSMLRHRGASEYSVDRERTTEASPVSPRSPLTVSAQVQKERSKSLSVFGTLVSPKLREAQVSFETALETLVEIANMRSKVLSAHAHFQQVKGGTSE